VAKFQETLNGWGPKQHGTHRIFEDNRDTAPVTAPNNRRRKTHGSVATSNLLFVFKRNSGEPVNVFRGPKGTPCRAWWPTARPRPGTAWGTQPNSGDTTTPHPSQNKFFNIRIQKVKLNPNINFEGKRRETAVAQGPRDVAFAREQLKENMTFEFSSRTQSLSELGLKGANNYRIGRVNCASFSRACLLTGGRGAGISPFRIIGNSGATRAP